VLAPGFIDMHSHTDYYLLVDPAAESKVSQGVTTEVCGNCGFSPGPLLSDLALERSRTTLARYGLAPQWRSLAEFLDLLDARRPGVNFAGLVGHGTLRASVMGYEARPPTAVELARMQGVLDDELAAGAFGLSSGLIYPPGCYAETEELVSLSQPVARRGGFYATHMRNENVRLVEAVAESLRIGREADCAVQISHHKACGRSNWGKVETTLRLLETARAEGLDVTADQYPYVATSTSLSSCLPKWAFEGGHDATMRRLRDPSDRTSLLQSVQESAATGYIADGGGWEAMTVAGVATSENRFAEGLTLRQLAETWDLAPEEAALRLLEEEALAASIVHFVISEDDVERVMRHPTTMIGSDGAARATSGPLCTGKPHPRTYGTFPRVLGHYVRERGVLNLAEAIHKMTGLPARRLGLADRGVVRVGAAADLVLFDPATVRDAATFTQPHQLAAGIDHVWVNGRAAIAAGQLTHDYAGRVLRHQG
jgi:N-acyl-D-amino-acid deacylase